MESKNIIFFVFAVLSQVTLQTSARPSDCGCEGGLPGYGGFGGLGGIGGLGGSGGFGGAGCGIPLPPPVSFLPVPQPVPIRVPTSRPQSVTIPNIIVALLPPNQKPVHVPRPVPVGPSPVVVPVPQPKPFLVPSPCEPSCC